MTKIEAITKRYTERKYRYFTVLAVYIPQPWQSSENEVFVPVVPHFNIMDGGDQTVTAIKEMMMVEREIMKYFNTKAYLHVK